MVAVVVAVVVVVVAVVVAVVVVVVVAVVVVAANVSIGSVPDIEAAVLSKKSFKRERWYLVICGHSSPVLISA